LSTYKTFIGCHTLPINDQAWTISLNHYFTKLGFTNVLPQGHSNIGFSKTIILWTCHHYNLFCPLDSGVYSLHKFHYTTTHMPQPIPLTMFGPLTLQSQPTLCFHYRMLLQTCHRYGLPCPLHSAMYWFHSTLPSPITNQLNHACTIYTTWSLHNYVPFQYHFRFVIVTTWQALSIIKCIRTFHYIATHMPPPIPLPWLNHSNYT
jgi:hypothetical protein